MLDYFIEGKEHLISEVELINKDDYNEDVMSKLFHLYDMIDEYDEIIKRLSGWYDTLGDKE